MTESIEITPVDDIADELMSQQPEVSEFVVNDEINETKKINENTPVDKNGKTFENGYHQVDSDGNPKLSRNGLLMIKPGRKDNSTPSSQQSSITQKSRQGSKLAGQAASNLMFTLGVIIGGEEWAPIIDEKIGMNEKTQMEEAFGNYFESKDIDDIPPGWALIACVSVYAAQRLRMPKTQSRFKKFKDWLTLKIVRMRGNNGAQSNTRDNRERENDFSKEIS